jgi:hypothetical protein
MLPANEWTLAKGSDVRALVPYYFVSTQPVGWKCSECGRVFRIRVSVTKTPQDPMPDIQAEFKSHKCKSATAKAGNAR